MICESQLPKRGKLNIGLIQSLTGRRFGERQRQQSMMETWFYQAKAESISGQQVLLRRQEDSTSAHFCLSYEWKWIPWNGNVSTDRPDTVGMFRPVVR
jgi:hypothetical protein